MTPSVGVVVNYCSNESMFIDAVLSECQKFSGNIVVSFGSHLYDGSPEGFDANLNRCKVQYPEVTFLEYQVDLQAPHHTLKGVVRRPTAYWCNLARWQGVEHLRNKVDYVLFLDADEVPEGEAFAKWFTINAPSLDTATVYKFGNYWYFKDPENQATTFEDSILMAPQTALKETIVFHDDERDAIFKFGGQRQRRMIMGLNDRPMFHHYSWVRSRAGLAKKMRTWAHRDDIFKGVDVDTIVNHIYRNNNVNDIIHNYEYVKTTPNWSFLTSS